VLIKKSIYPTQEEFYDVTNEFLNENHEDFIISTQKGNGVLFTKNISISP